MTQEEKSKAYDKAVEIAKTMIDDLRKGEDILSVSNLEAMFPELKESEDEHIRKSIIDLVEKRMPKSENKKWMIAWLEKQGEQKPIIEMKSPEESLGIDSDTYNKIVDECIWGKQEEPQVYETDNGEVITYSESEGYKVVEPKFKVGDWILIDNPCQIESIDNNGNYIVRYCDAEETHLLSRNFCDSHFHLWSIQDAKDGDVLANWNNTAFIFKAIEDETVKYHIAYNEKWGAIKTPSTKSSHLGLPEPQFEFYPATKEQRDLLFQKMHEAGYMWDSESKQLLSLKAEPMVEQKLAWSEEDEICTSIEQSKKLIELGLDVNTADMFWDTAEPLKRIVPTVGHISDYYDMEDWAIPAWSLSALLELLPDELQDNHFLTLEKEKNEYCCCFEDINGNSFNHFFGNSAIDVVFKMVCWLLENKKI